MNKSIRFILLLIAVFLIGVAIVLLEQSSVQKRTGDTNVLPNLAAKNKASRFEAAKEISTPDGFINTDKITLSQLIGKKVILIDFWTYSCINCQRTTPYLNAWYEKYKDEGLEIIGVHTPEFDFEKDYDNVVKAVEKFGIKYPVILDNDYSTWQAYRNQYWPRKYLIDIDGYIVYDHIGEGGYAETEKKIQEALSERIQVLNMAGNVATDIVRPTGTLQVDSPKSLSPETYFGAKRNEFGNGVSSKTGLQTFSRPANINPNLANLSGDWDIKEEFAENKSKGAKIVFSYRAKIVYLVAGADKPVTVEVRRDGNLVKTIQVQTHQLYSLIEEQSYSEHTLELIIQTPGLQAFTFTFG